MSDSILEVIYESAKGLFNIGLMDIKTMGKIEELCLSKENTDEKIKSETENSKKPK